MDVAFVTACMFILLGLLLGAANAPMFMIGLMGAIAFNAQPRSVSIFTRLHDDFSNEEPTRAP